MIKHNFILLVYNKDVTCIIDEGKDPVCKTSPRISRRSEINIIPSHDPYIPRNKSTLFNCSTVCHLIAPNSISDVVSPYLHLKSCYVQEEDTYECEPLRYQYLKNVDKVLFLSKTIRDKSFYLVDCLIYSGGERVCHKKNNNRRSYASLLDTGTLARPNESSILAQDEFICEESDDKEVICDLNPYVPFENGLKLKEFIKFGESVLLRSGSYVVLLKRSCIDSWCGYVGKVASTRRQFKYRPPGGKVFRCYYAKQQQICKEWYSPSQKPVYNERGFL